jgi:hypothetical protein
MKVILQKSSRRWIGLLGGLVMGGFVSAQAADISSQSAEPSDDLSAFVHEQRILANEISALVSQGATEQQLEAWQQQNAALIQAQRQEAQKLTAQSALQPGRVVRRVNVPRNASSTLKDFLITQAKLANARAQIHNQLLQTLPTEATQDQIIQMQQQEELIFEEQHAADLQLQRPPIPSRFPEAQRSRPMAHLDCGHSWPRAWTWRKTGRGRGTNIWELILKRDGRLCNNGSSRMPVASASCVSSPKI